MPVPSTMADLTVSAATCNPPGGETIGTSGDDYHRGIQAIVRRESARGADLTVSGGGILTPGNDGRYFIVATPATISGIAHTWVGREITLAFLGPATIVHSSNLMCPGGTNINVVSGRVYQFVEETSTPVWRCTGSDAVTGPAGPPGATGAPGAPGGGVASVTIQAYGTPGAYTWVRPTGCRKVFVRVIGAGGAGAGAVGTSVFSASGGGGGGAGEYAEALINVASVSTAGVSVATGGVPLQGQAGGAGQGLTAFGSFISVNGGAGGPTPTFQSASGITGLGGPGGTGSNSPIRSAGEPGDYGVAFAGGQATSGKGGSGPFGGGGRPQFSSIPGTVIAGASGLGFGSGGSGGVTVQSATTPAPGGNGANGLCVIVEFY